MVAHRIADPVILSLIGKWVASHPYRGGYSTGRSDLARIYLHFLLDLWFENQIKPACRVKRIWCVSPMMCAISPGARFPSQREEVQKETFGLTANLNSKGNRDSSMPLKREAF
jgi:hypothetical protein